MDHISRKSAPAGVLPVGRELGQGGSERQLAVTAMGLRRERFQPQVGTFRPGGFRLRELREAGVASACFPLPGFTRPAAMARAGSAISDIDVERFRPGGKERPEVLRGAGLTVA